jgi:hypothetical protein
MISRRLENDSDIKEQILNKGDVVVLFNGGDGMMLANVKNFESFSYLKAYEEFDGENLQYYLAYTKAFDDSDVEINFEYFPKKGKAILETMTIDQNTLDGADEIIDFLKYSDNWGEIKVRANQIAKTLLRKEKLEQIEKSEK